MCACLGVCVVGLRVPPSGRVSHAFSAVAIDLLRVSCGCTGCFAVLVLFFALITCSTSIDLRRAFCSLRIAFGFQVPMVGKGVVEAVMATLVAVQGWGAQALPVQETACGALWNFAVAADNRVRIRGWDRPGF